MRLWQVADGELLRALPRHNACSVAFSPDGATLASGAWDRKERLWQVADGSLLRTLEGHLHWVDSVGFSPDGRLLVSGSEDGARLWGVAP